MRATVVGVLLMTDPKKAVRLVKLSASVSPVRSDKSVLNTLSPMTNALEFGADFPNVNVADLSVVPHKFAPDKFHLVSNFVLLEDSRR